MLPTTNILNNFHDKKRRLEYYRIAKLIEDENKKNPNRYLFNFCRIFFIIFRPLKNIFFWLIL